jgi:hypothetical protein
MDEEIQIINSNTHQEKIKNFLRKNKIIIISFISIILIIIASYFGYNEFKNQKKIKISNFYNKTTLNHSTSNNDLTLKNLISIINKKEPTYSPLSLYFIIDNELTLDKENINDLFDIIINQTTLKKEIKNLIIYKKALYFADYVEEDKLLKILNPVINSGSIWQSHALYLMAEYFYSKNEMEKAKEFFNEILIGKNSNEDIIQKAQRRLKRDLSE